ncbi:hypothetical protein [Tateyamaria sp. ANG-S1]|uniref:hypothetical protein n=1 Tax=Tateyamaria sp. ANG-S1 TaxID=1577905 RepID=UPI00126A4BB0|nr:hypothetical protein [Tateyamaria sp. ANG-S1]
MVVFQDIQDVEEWLEPLDYIAFWEAVAPYGVFSIADRDHCDGLISGGTVVQDLILECIKAMARNSLRDGFGLKHRPRHTHADQGLRSLH